MAGVTIPSGTDPIEERGDPIEVRLADGESVTVPQGKRYHVSVHSSAAGRSSSETFVKYKPKGGNAERIIGESASNGLSSANARTVFFGGGTISVYSSFPPAILLGFEVDA